MRSCRTLPTIVATCVFAANSMNALGGPPPPAPPGIAAELPQEARQLLDAVRDNVFSFDDPAFYWLCRFARTTDGQALLALAPTDPPLPWKFLLERPSEYRGRTVVIEGVLRARNEYEVANHLHVGKLAQFDLAEEGTRAICTVICVDNRAQTELGQRVLCKGFFLKCRAYQTTGGEGGAGPLIVGVTLHAMGDSPASTAGQGDESRLHVLAATIGGLVIVWLTLRLRSRRSGRATGRPTAFVKTAESDDDFSWLTKDSSGDGPRSD